MTSQLLAAILSLRLTSLGAKPPEKVPRLPAKSPEKSAPLGDPVGQIGRSKLCFDAVGEPKELYERTIETQITNYLNKHFSSVPGNDRVTLSLYMVGQSEETAVPTIIFIAKSQKTRKEARKAMKDCNVLSRFPAFQIEYLRRDPCCDSIEELASDGATTVDRPAIQVFYDSSKSVRALGQAIYIKHASSLRPATANVVRIGNQIFLQTVYHAFLRPLFHSIDSTSSSAPKNDSEDDSTSDDETDDAEVAIMSKASATPDSVWDRASSSSGSSRRSSVFSTSSTPKSRAQIPRQMDVKAILDDATTMLSPFAWSRRRYPATKMTALDPESLAPLGKLVHWSQEKDIALIEVTDPIAKESLRTALEASDASAYNRVARVSTGNAKVYAHTASGGRLYGTLSSRPTSTRLPNSRTFQKVHVVRLNGALANGDCGSAVIDVVTGETYGHLVAGCKSTGTAYILGAHQVLDVFSNVPPTSHCLADALVACGPPTKVPGRLAQNLLMGPLLTIYYQVIQSLIVCHFSMIHLLQELKLDVVGFLAILGEASVHPAEEITRRTHCVLRMPARLLHWLDTNVVLNAPASILISLATLTPLDHRRWSFTGWLGDPDQIALHWTLARPPGYDVQQPTEPFLPPSILPPLFLVASVITTHWLTRVVVVNIAKTSSVKARSMLALAVILVAIIYTSRHISIPVLASAPRQSFTEGYSWLSVFLVTWLSIDYIPWARPRRFIRILWSIWQLMFLISILCKGWLAYSSMDPQQLTSMNRYLNRAISCLATIASYLLMIHLVKSVTRTSLVKTIMIGPPVATLRKVALVISLVFQEYGAYICSIMLFVALCTRILVLDDYGWPMLVLLITGIVHCLSILAIVWLNTSIASAGSLNNYQSYFDEERPHTNEVEVIVSSNSLRSWNLNAFFLQETKNWKRKNSGNGPITLPKLLLFGDQTARQQDLRILRLDGGGIRGYSWLLVMKKLMESAVIEKILARQQEQLVIQRISLLPASASLERASDPVQDGPGQSGHKATRMPSIPSVYIPTVTFFDPLADDVDIETVAKHAVRLAKAGVANIQTKLLDKSSRPPDDCRNSQNQNDGMHYTILVPPQYYRDIGRPRILDTHGESQQNRLDRSPGWTEHEPLNAQREPAHDPPNSFGLNAFLISETENWKRKYPGSSAEAGSSPPSRSEDKRFVLHVDYGTTFTGVSFATSYPESGTLPKLLDWAPILKSDKVPSPISCRRAKRPSPRPVVVKPELIIDIGNRRRRPDEPRYQRTSLTSTRPPSYYDSTDEIGCKIGPFNPPVRSNASFLRRNEVCHNCGMRRYGHDPSAQCKRCFASPHPSPIAPSQLTSDPRQRPLRNSVSDTSVKSRCSSNTLPPSKSSVGTQSGSIHQPLDQDLLCQEMAERFRQPFPGRVCPDPALWCVVGRQRRTVSSAAGLNQSLPAASGSELRSASPPSYSSLRIIPLVPTPPTDSRSLRFKSMLQTLSSVPKGQMNYEARQTLIMALSDLVNNNKAWISENRTESHLALLSALEDLRKCFSTIKATSTSDSKHGEILDLLEKLQKLIRRQASGKSKFTEPEELKIRLRLSDLARQDLIMLNTLQLQAAMASTPDTERLSRTQDSEELLACMGLNSANQTPTRKAISIWEIGRATSAAPFYFNTRAPESSLPFEFIDGGVRDARIVFPHSAAPSWTPAISRGGKTQLARQYVASIGTRLPGPSPKPGSSPYFCTFSGDSGTEKVFKTKQDWKRHCEDYHERSVWIHGLGIRNLSKSEHLLSAFRSSTVKTPNRNELSMLDPGYIQPLLDNLDALVDRDDNLLIDLLDPGENSNRGSQDNLMDWLFDAHMHTGNGKERGSDDMPPRGGIGIIDTDDEICNGQEIDKRTVETREEQRDAEVEEIDSEFL